MKHRSVACKSKALNFHPIDSNFSKVFGKYKPPYNGFILHFDGHQWRELLMTDFGVQFLAVRENRGKLFVRGVKRQVGGGVADTLALYRNNKEGLKEMLNVPGDGRGIRIWGR